MGPAERPFDAFVAHIAALCSLISVKREGGLWVVNWSAVAHALKEAICVEVPRWSYAEDSTGGVIFMGPPGCRLGRVWFDGRYPRGLVWRWGLTRLVHQGEHHEGGRPDLLLAMQTVEVRLREMQLRRAPACPGCGDPRLDACEKDVVLVPGVALCVCCLRDPQHEGDHLPICECCAREVQAAEGTPFLVNQSRFSALVPRDWRTPAEGRTSCE